ncbi:hypothetical protein OAN10_03025 [Alphaproteobacteria bacterium]|nr:hypothetical protein [Alphaproteobacteria bacterium]
MSDKFNEISKPKLSGIRTRTSSFYQSSSNKPFKIKDNCFFTFIYIFC